MATPVIVFFYGLFIFFFDRISHMVAQAVGLPYSLPARASQMWDHKGEPQASANLLSTNFQSHFCL